MKRQNPLLSFDYLCSSQRFVTLVAAAAALAFLTSCASSGGDDYYTIDEEGSAPYTEPSGTTEGDGGARPYGSPDKPKTAKYPKAKKVSGKLGIVKSPYAPQAGDVEVSGIAPGTVVKCPYTGKRFIVP